MISSRAAVICRRPRSGRSARPRRSWPRRSASPRGRRAFRLVGRGSAANSAGVTSQTSSVSPGMIMEPPRLRLIMIACRSVMSSITSQNRIRGRSWSAALALQPLEDGLPGPFHVGQVRPVHLEHAELALDEQDAGLHGRHRAQRQVGHRARWPARAPPRRSGSARPASAGSRGPGWGCPGTPRTAFAGPGPAGAPAVRPGAARPAGRPGGALTRRGW